jgi:TRAP-type C4-dicarboxylate transport system permease small subunit
MDVALDPTIGHVAALAGGAPPDAELNPIRIGIRRLFDALHMVAKLFAVIALVSELMIVVSDVASRALFAHSFLWSDEAAKLVLSVIAFVGGAVAYREDRHASVALLVNLFPP